MEYLMIFLLALLFFYLLILKGLPWIASKYASYRFGAHVGVKTIDFISRSLRDVSFRTTLPFSSHNKKNEVAISLGKLLKIYGPSAKDCIFKIGDITYFRGHFICLNVFFL